MRIIAGISIVGVALFVILGEHLSGASADAVVNARLTTLRAPIAGRLTLERRDLGVLVEAGEALGSVDDPLVDDIRLNDLVLERDTAYAEAERLKQEVAALEDAISSLKERSARYSVERIRHLEARLEQRRS
ncbi:MAG: curli assembly protein CsgC, partial [Rhizobiales bacterium]|nr:curli assembly protein CsgC [Hyphomicrobiales bacterium]